MADDVPLASQLAASSGLYSLFLEGALTDVELVASDGERIGAHRVVLASCSKFFKAVLAGAGLDMQEAAALRQGRLEVSGVDGPSLRALLHAVYSQRLRVGGHNVQQLLAASGYLAIEPIQAACCAYLQSHLSLSTCVDSLLLAFHYDCHELFDTTLRYLEAHFPELMAAGGEERGRLGSLPQPLMARLLASDSLNTPSELEVARAAAVWLAADPLGRAAGAGELLSAVRLPGPDLLQQMEGDGIWAQLPPDAAPLARRALLEACGSLAQAPRAPAAGAGLGRGGGFPPRQSTPTRLLVVGGVDEGWRSLKTVELYDPTRDSWSPGPAMPSACSFPAGATVGGCGLVVEGAAHAAAVLAFHPRKRAWAPAPHMLAPRVNSAAAALPGMLLVLGGRAGRAKDSHVLRDAECLILGEGRWAALPPMATPRSALGAAALGGAVYAVGGQSDRATHATAEWLDPGAEAWAPVGAAMQEPRKYLAAAALGGRLYAVGGMTHARRRLASVEALDPREGRWHQLAPMSVARSSCGAAVLGEELYVVGGSITAEAQSHDGVEAYCPRAGRWRACAPISHGRSGLAVLPV